ncbi:hypothetical protein E1B28_008550 [Marasmius oreades]|uniref:Uncharacterized protein n=1 Tax=Marasmius oreades TaxID=181124 RepID=A0A9P7RZU6_9AGAR|nr:uncharacterized protein E1B28_008550 [Marasmius oreades]KAG7092181.1 hypothetical protein E1B28_008550 [Marasmius oreades]
MSMSFSPTPAETALVGQIFAQADTSKLGILQGDDAVRIFGGAKVPPTVLGEIWNIADDDQNGWLSRKGTAVALRLIGWAQKGEKVTKELVHKPGPIPVVEGLSSVSVHHTGMSIPKSPPPGTGLPSITQADKTKFHNMFLKAGPVNGLLSADQARDIFVKSKLPNDTLLRIWNLADTQDRGTLDATDFALGMYFIQALMHKAITNLPESLPPGLYQQAQLPIASLSQNLTGTRSPNQSSFPQNRVPVQPQYTGQAASILQPQSTGMAVQQQSTGMLQAPNASLSAPKRIPPTLPARPSASQVGNGAFGGAGSLSSNWDVTAEEKANADRYFVTLDSTKQGFIEGDVAVPFMLESKLPDDVLAHIWDLSDLHNNGRLTRDCFAVAMHLIQKKLGGGELPTTVPQSLIPPAMRATGSYPFSPPSTGPPPSRAPAQMAPEPTKDLFSFDDSPPASATSNGPFDVSIQATGSQPSAFSSPAPPATFSDPFGSSSGRDLLSDDDGSESTPALHDRSAEVGNAQNQLNSTNRSLETVKAERTNVDDALANQAVQLSSLQTQLSVAKAAYETETKALAALKERHTTQSAEIQKARQELITAESDLSALRVEKVEIEGAFMRDKEEARELHRKMVEASKDAETLRAETEKAKKDAKQQKGLLAIAKKQLSSKEADRAKAEKELEETNAEVAAARKEREEAEAELEKYISSPPVVGSPVDTSASLLPERAASADSLAFAAAQPLPTTPEPLSPSGITTKSTNPFERLAMSGSPRPQSPFLPFANAAINTPPIGESKPAEEPAEKTNGDISDDDPFGFLRMNDTAVESPPQPLSGTETPKGVPPTSLVISPVASDSVSPPTTANELFSTPPSTAPLPAESSPLRQTTLDAVSKFPDIDGFVPVATSITEGKKAAEPSETDLGSSLKELEVEDSDSDSEEEDEVPLATLQKRMSADIDTIAGSKSKATSPPSASFDDIFDTESTPAASPTSVQKTDAFGLPIKENGDTSDLFGSQTQPGSTVSQVPSTTEAGVNAFDEAMGKLSPTSPSVPAQFSSFDAAFEDNFDFVAAGGTSFTSTPTANGHATSTGDSFDNLFVSQSASGPPTASAPQVPPTSLAPSTPPRPSNNQPTTGPSFDEVFSGFGSSPSLTLDGSNSRAPDMISAAKPATQNTEMSRNPTIETTSSPRSSDLGSTSPPPRQKSPPPRTASPKPPRQRPSTGSSIRDGHEKPDKKEPPPTRTSKLSIRLPFGRKKKNQEAPPIPPPSQMLTPPQEEPREDTPAADDDVEAVKQLTDMGFSRSQAVEALEKYGYDIPRALNSLLGQA